MLPDDLLKEAKSSCDRAYAVYSGFKVGAALRATTGEVFGGCNIENLSYGLTICAERVAIFSAIALGHKDFDILVIVTDSHEPAVPCGACRQVLAEFNANLKIFSATNSGRRSEFNLAELLPLPRQGILEGSA